MMAMYQIVKVLLKPSFEIIPLVSGGFGSWSEWSFPTCGPRKRTRTCDDPPASNGGSDCSGARVQWEHLSTEPCRSEVYTERATMNGSM